MDGAIVFPCMEPNPSECKRHPPHPGVNTPADLLTHGGFAAADVRTYSHAHVFVFSPQPAASFRDKTCLVNSILMWIICCTAGSSDSSRGGKPHSYGHGNLQQGGDHAAGTVSTCSPKNTPHPPQVVSKKSDRAARCAVTRLPPAENG